MHQTSVQNRSFHDLVCCNFNISILQESELLGLEQWCLVSTSGCGSRQCRKTKLRSMVQNLWQVLAVEVQSQFLTTGWWSYENLRGSGLRASHQKALHITAGPARGFQSQYPCDAFPCTTSAFTWQVTHRTWGLFCLSHFLEQNKTSPAK